MTSNAVQLSRLEPHNARCSAIGESPVWRATEDALYWVDIPAQTLVRYELTRARRTEWLLPERIGSFAFDHDGTVLAAMESGLFAVTLEEPLDNTVSAGSEKVRQGSASVRSLAKVTHDAAHMRFNDGRCDRQGRFWAGTMVQDTTTPHPAGKLYRYDACSGLSMPVVKGLCTQNGLAWSPDGRTMYLSDSHPSSRLIWSFDYDIDDGMPTRRRVFTDLHESTRTGRPDGAAIDAEGCYWTCANDAGLLLRFTPDGRLDRKLALPAAKPSMCAFGGTGLDTLFVTTIRPDPAGKHDGYVFALYPGVRGLPEPEFAGAL